MCHQDPRLTTADETKSLLSAGGASEPQRPADTRAKERTAARLRWHLLPGYYPIPPPEPSERPRPRTAATEFRELTVVGARGFEPPTFRSRTERATRLRHAPWLTLWKAGYAKLISASQRLYAAQPHAPQENVDQEQRERGEQDGRPQRLARLAAVAAPGPARRARRSPAARPCARPPPPAAPAPSPRRRVVGGRSSGANGSVRRPLAVGDRACRPPPAVAVNSSAPASMSGRKLAS